MCSDVINVRHRFVLVFRHNQPVWRADDKHRIMDSFSSLLFHDRFWGTFAMWQSHHVVCLWHVSVSISWMCNSVAVVHSHAAPVQCWQVESHQALVVHQCAILTVAFKLYLPFDGGILKCRNICVHVVSPVKWHSITSLVVGLCGLGSKCS